MDIKLCEECDMPTTLDNGLCVQCDMDTRDEKPFKVQDEDIRINAEFAINRKLKILYNQCYPLVINADPVKRGIYMSRMGDAVHAAEHATITHNVEFLSVLEWEHLRFVDKTNAIYMYDPATEIVIAQGIDDGDHTWFKSRIVCKKTIINSTRCNVCGKMTKNACSKCHATHYCGKECLAADWKYHKIICRHKLKKQKKFAFRF